MSYLWDYQQFSLWKNSRESQHEPVLQKLLSYNSDLSNITTRSSNYRARRVSGPKNIKFKHAGLRSALPSLDNSRIDIVPSSGTSAPNHIATTDNDTHDFVWVQDLIPRILNGNHQYLSRHAPYKVSTPSSGKRNPQEKSCENDNTEIELDLRCKGNDVGQEGSQKAWKSENSRILSQPHNWEASKAPLGCSKTGHSTRSKWRVNIEEGLPQLKPRSGIKKTDHPRSAMQHCRRNQSISLDHAHLVLHPKNQISHIDAGSPAQDFTRPMFSDAQVLSLSDIFEDASVTELCHIQTQDEVKAVIETFSCVAAHFKELSHLACGDEVVSNTSSSAALLIGPISHYVAFAKDFCLIRQVDTALVKKRHAYSFFTEEYEHGGLARKPSEAVSDIGAITQSASNSDAGSFWRRHEQAPCVNQPTSFPHGTRCVPQHRGMNSSGQSSNGAQLISSSSQSGGNANFANSNLGGQGVGEGDDHDGRNPGQIDIPKSNNKEVYYGFHCVYHNRNNQYDHPDKTTDCCKVQKCISQLERHHGVEAHKFFYCRKCFSRFKNKEERKVHKRVGCTFRCLSESCSKDPITFQTTCSHDKNDSISQWRELFRLARESERVPDPQDVLAPIVRSLQPSTPCMPSQHATTSNSSTAPVSEGMSYNNGSLGMDQSTNMPPTEPNATPLTFHSQQPETTSLRFLETLASMLWDLVNSENPSPPPLIAGLYRTLMATEVQGHHHTDSDYARTVRGYEYFIEQLWFWINSPGSRTSQTYYHLHRVALSIMPQGSGQPDMPTSMADMESRSHWGPQVNVPEEGVEISTQQQITGYPRFIRGQNNNRVFGNNMDNEMNGMNFNHPTSATDIVVGQPPTPEHLTRPMATSQVSPFQDPHEPPSNDLIFSNTQSQLHEPQQIMAENAMIQDLASGRRFEYGLQSTYGTASAFDTATSFSEQQSSSTGISSYGTTQGVLQHNGQGISPAHLRHCFNGEPGPIESINPFSETDDWNAAENCDVD